MALSVNYVYDYYFVIDVSHVLSLLSRKYNVLDVGLVKHATRHKDKDGQK